VIEHDHERLLIPIRELIDFLGEAVQLRVVDVGVAVSFLPSCQLVETDIESRLKLPTLSVYIVTSQSLDGLSKEAGFHSGAQ
jgi:hypothetical protein